MKSSNSNKNKKNKLQKVFTVNVIEQVDGEIIGGNAWIDNDLGNKAAEKHFKKIAKENGAKKKNMEDLLDDGIFEKGNYRVIITHI